MSPDRPSTPIGADLDAIVAALRHGREEIFNDWLDRVRDNRAVETGRALSDPILLDHMPRLFDAMLDRLEVSTPREHEEHYAAVHGITRRVTGYDPLETVIELLMFRRAIWAYVTAAEVPLTEAYAAMERIDGMVDRAVIASLKAFLDPNARMLERKGEPADPPE